MQQFCVPQLSVHYLDLDDKQQYGKINSLPVLCFAVHICTSLSQETTAKNSNFFRTRLVNAPNKYIFSKLAQTFRYRSIPINLMMWGVRARSFTYATIVLYLTRSAYSWWMSVPFGRAIWYLCVQAYIINDRSWTMHFSLELPKPKANIALRPVHINANNKSNIRDVTMIMQSTRVR